MIRYFTALFIFLLAGCSSRLSKGVEGVLPQGSRVAVITYVVRYDLFGNKVAIAAPDEITATIENVLLGLGYQPVDRNLLFDVIKEQKLSLTGAVKPEESATVGKLSGAQHLLITSIGYDGEKPLSLATRLIDADTGNILSSHGASFPAYKKDQRGYWTQIFFRFNKAP